jgi:hypothetical protein
VALAKRGELAWPLTSEQLELIDRMFDELYDQTDRSRFSIVLPDDITGVLDVPHGGTGLDTYVVGDILYASAADVLARLADVATGNALISGGVGNAPSWGKIGLTTHVTGVLPIANGGTNLSTYAQGDILYASAADTLAKLPKNTTATRYLSNSGVSNAPAWAAVELSNGVNGTLPTGNGGTGVSSWTTGAVVIGGSPLSAVNPAALGKVLRAQGVFSAPTYSAWTTPDNFVAGDILYASAADTLTALPKNTTATRYLSNTGASNVPAWAQVDLSNGVTGVLPYANLTNATAASLLLGRGSAGGAGVWQEITLGSGLTMTNQVLSASGGGTWDVLTNGDAADPEVMFDSFGDVVMLFTP